MILTPKTVIEYHGFCTMEECPVCHDRECKAPRWWGLFLRHRGIQIIKAVCGPNPSWHVANYRTDLRLLLKGNRFNEPFRCLPKAQSSVLFRTMREKAALREWTGQGNAG